MLLLSMLANLAAPAVLASNLHLSMRANLAAPAVLALTLHLSMLANLAAPAVLASTLHLSMRANLAAPAVLASTLHLSMRANLAAPAGFALCPDLSMLAKRSICFVPRSDWRLGEGGIGCWQWARAWRCGDGLGGGRWLFLLQPSSKRARRDVLDPAPAGCGGAADTAGAGLGIGGRCNVRVTGHRAVSLLSLVSSFSLTARQ